jgi:hypothetical protein
MAYGSIAREQLPRKCLSAAGDAVARQLKMADNGTSSAQQAAEMELRQPKSFHRLLISSTVCTQVPHAVSVGQKLLWGLKMSLNSPCLILVL